MVCGDGRHPGRRPASPFVQYGPPPVHVERLIADHEIRSQRLPGGTAAPTVRLPPRVRDLQIDYTALSFVAPEKVRFRYRLDGQDTDWREVVNERHVQYSNLHPGTYRFRVIAANNSGLWNEQGDVLEFSIAPAYYQTAWFAALCGAGGLGLLWAAYRVRVRQLHHRFEMALEARVSERTRIARELHDTLLQSFQGLLLRFQTVSQLWAERPEQAKEKLDSAINEAANAITEGRNAVQGLRESTVGTSDITDAIGTLGAELAGARGDGPAPAFHVTVEGEPRPLHPILRDDIYKITAEALRNAFRHAEATTSTSRSATTASSSGYACRTMERGSTQSGSLARRRPATTGCPGCGNARSSWEARSRCGARRAQAPPWSSVSHRASRT